jgi:hypothetical protein
MTACLRGIGALMTGGVFVLAGIVGVAQDGPAGPRRFPLFVPPLRESADHRGPVEAD